MKGNEFIDREDFDFVLSRYNQNFTHEYFNRNTQVAYIFYDRFFSHLEACDKNFDRQEKEFFKEYLLRHLKYIHSNKCYTVTSSKINSDMRYYHIANIYLVILFELFVSRIIKILNEEVMKRIWSDLIWKQYFWYAHQVEWKGSKPYSTLWKMYEEMKNDILKDKKIEHYLTSDIKEFYDSVSHAKLINLIGRLFRDFVGSEYYMENDIDNFLHEFSNILFKISQYKKYWIPQGLRWSDFLGTLFIRLIFFYERQNDKIELKYNKYYECNGCKIIIYVDDFVIFSKNKKDIKETLFIIRNLLQKYELKINNSKTTVILETINYKPVSGIDIEKIRINDINELSSLKTYIEKEIKEKSHIGILENKEFKTYFKWFYKTHTLWDNPLYNIILDLFSNGTLEGTEKALLLIRISESNICMMIKETFVHNKNIEKIFTNFIEKNKHHLSDSSLIYLYNFFSKVFSGNFIELKNILKDFTKKKGNHVLDCFIGFVETKKRFFDPYLIKNNFHWLKKLFYESAPNIMEDKELYNENIIGIKLKDLFDIEMDLSAGLMKVVRGNLCPHTFLYKISDVIDSLLIIKNLDPNYYLKSASFMADLFSLFNQLLSILFSLEEKKFVKVKICFGNQISWKNISITTTSKDGKESSKDWRIDKFESLRDNLLFFYYLQKKRADLNHKEVEINQENYEVYNVNKYNNTETLFNATKLIMGNILSLIKEKDED